MTAYTKEELLRDWGEALDCATAPIAAVHRERRERIATACMAGMLANPDVDPWRVKVAVDAVFHADALIAELDKPKEGPT